MLASATQRRARGGARLSRALGRARAAGVCQRGQGLPAASALDSYHLSLPAAAAAACYEGRWWPPRAKGFPAPLRGWCPRRSPDSPSEGTAPACG